MEYRRHQEIPRRYRVTESRWQGIIQNKLEMDEKYLYGVVTTRIFCRPSCKSPVPQREHVRIFKDPEEAIEDGFRPCKRCKPTGVLPAAEWVEQMKEYMHQHYQEALTLESIATACHGSPYYLQRLFSRKEGVSPTEYLSHYRLKQAEKMLVETNLSIKEIGARVGIPNPSHFNQKFKKAFHQSPGIYRRQKEKHL